MLAHFDTHERHCWLIRRLNTPFIWLYIRSLPYLSLCCSSPAQLLITRAVLLHSQEINAGVTEVACISAGKAVTQLVRGATLNFFSFLTSHFPLPHPLNNILNTLSTLFCTCSHVLASINFIEINSLKLQVSSELLLGVHDADHGRLQTQPNFSPSTTMVEGHCVHFGGGNIGRGFIAELLHDTGYSVIFVDVIDNLVNQINDAKSYKITEVGAEGTKTKTITNYRAINSKYDMDDVVQSIADAEVVTCAVGPNVLKFIAKPIADGITKRTKSKPLAVIACENMINATDALKALIIDEKNMSKETLKDLPSKAEFGNSAIDRIVPTQPTDAGMDVLIESFYEWCVETSGFKSGHPKINGIHWVDNLEPFIERKLFTVNTSHATAAYFGYAKGIKTIHEAMADPEIKKEVYAALEETAHLITTKHGVSKEEQEKYVNTIITRISNPHLEDIPARVGRAPLRKLGRKERFIGPAAQLAEQGYDVKNLMQGVEMALRFQNVEGDEESVELAKIMKDMSADEATTKLTGLEKDHPLYPKVLERVKKVQGSS